jgi:hypothetical protein
MIARHFSFQLKPGHPVWPMLRVTLRPAGGLPMIVSRRPAAECSSWLPRHQPAALGATHS